ncbi:PQQ-binding-like beta-propeller repeat protein [Rhodococcus sp. SORGH_AS_0303]|uniref:outer membrane protein assembly factor BamB family protein n=1 Tax=Rhodococcus sp. SORGH_AS_0303 TaxID=3041753 RepID=UPI00277FA90B|nr:PQQ-binding-like beta-propeller repeat protein [Rhodococcus sp. SORGH_AS_0303]MDQ1201265.1 outer membrane protein assembly factor BamB [Rhodococcus sp. SORGH_AS_0303]
MHDENPRTSVRTRRAGAALLAVGALALGACGSDSGPIDILGDEGWRGGLADAHNSASVTTEGSRSLALDWTRPLGAPTSTRPSVAPNGQITVTMTGDAGCALGSFQGETGRKRFCNSLGPSGVSSTAVADSASNLYAGDDGSMSSINQNGQLRWRTPVYGVPRTPQFLPDGNVLVVTQFGQINVLSNQTGNAVAPVLDLNPNPTPLDAPNTTLRPADDGLLACLGGGPDCAVAAAPAVDLESSTVYLVLWRAGAIAPQLVALSYTGGDSPGLTEAWSSPLLPAAVTSSPVVSPDGDRVYLTDVEGTVRAYSTEDGSEIWSYFVGDRAAGSVSVAADGTIVPAGGAGSHLRAIRDAGERPETVWERPDLVTQGSSALAGGTTGYTVVGDGDGLALVTFDTATGETVDTDALPGAEGYSPGVVVGSDGEVVVPTALGSLYSFR